MNRTPSLWPWGVAHVLVMCSLSCTQQIRPLPTTRGNSPPEFAVQAVDRDVRLLRGERAFTDRLHALDRPQWDYWFNEPYKDIHQFAEIVGPGLYAGVPHAPLHFADIVHTPTGKRTSLFVMVVSDDGHINRAWLGWKSEELRKVRVAARLCAREGWMSPVPDDRMTCELNIVLHDQEGVILVFAGYDWRGNRVPAFGRPFDEDAGSHRQPATARDALQP